MSLSVYRTTAADVTPVTVTSNTDPTAQIAVRGFNIINPNTYAVYIKFYDVNYTSVTVGSTAVKSTLLIPANGSIYEPAQTGKDIVFCATFLTYAITKFLADTDNTAIATNISVEFIYELEGN